jgi:hypothetical protein
VATVLSPSSFYLSSGVKLEPIAQGSTQALALVPGILGDYMRRAFHACPGTLRPVGHGPVRDNLQDFGATDANVRGRIAT